MREPTFFILLSLAGHTKHGYAILKDVETLSGGKIKLSNGTLYGAIVRLQEQGLIERVPDGDSSMRESQESGRPRKAYRLTDEGSRVLNAEVSRMQGLVRTAQMRLVEEME